MTGVGVARAGISAVGWLVDAVGMGRGNFTDWGYLGVRDYLFCSFVVRGGWEGGWVVDYERCWCRGARHGLELVLVV